MASVEIQTPDGVIRVRLDGDHYTIGRLTTNDIALPYPHISRQHAELRLMGQTWWLVDLHSTNGLHVSGQRVGESKLQFGNPVMLSPFITMSLLNESATSYPQSQTTQPQPPYAQEPYTQPPYPQGPQSLPQQPMWAPTPQPTAANYPSMPMREPNTPQPRREPMREAITPLSALGPRSPYADDEAPFYPQMRPMQPTGRAHPTYAVAPQDPWQARAAALPRAAAAQAGAQMGPMHPNGFDPQRQAAQVYEQRRSATAGPSPLLHVCQTCGQRTPPDSVYCQNCHHAIASECMRCRLSLLPIQDLCPRCQTPNPTSVRRARFSAGPS